MMNRFLHKITVLLLLALLLTACASRKAEKAVLQKRCPQVFVLNHADKISGKAPGFERTDRIFYEIAFEKIEDSCKVSRKQVEIDFFIEMIVQKDDTIRAVLPNFSIFTTFVDARSTPLWRETFDFEPRDWKQGKILRVREKIRVTYPVADNILPRTVYFGFVTSPELLRESYTDNQIKN